MQNPALAESSLQEAAARLRESISFSRGDPQPHNALGDTFVAAAERVSGDPAAALSLLNTALEEGYAAALRLNSQDPNALVGTAEVKFQNNLFAVWVMLCRYHHQSVSFTIPSLSASHLGIACETLFFKGMLWYEWLHRCVMQFSILYN